MIHIRYCAGFAMMLFAACGTDDNAPGDENVNDSSQGDSALVSVARVTGGVRITNGTETPIAYMVWNRGYLALFAPCIDPSPACVRLAAGATVTVPDAQIEGAASGMTEALVRWWHVLPDGQGGYRASRIIETIVRL